MKINCLDKGYVRLVDHMGSDLSIVRAARVSFDADWRTGLSEGNDEKLIQYLFTHKHSTPFEAVELVFEVKAPIFVFRQWQRHRTWSYSEVSARYQELSEFHVPDIETIAKQSKSNKQGREDQPMDLEDATAVQLLLSANHRACFSSYQTLLDAGVAREMAREVLSVATYSRMFAKVNLWNLMKFLSLRLDKHAQYEIRVYAEACLTMAFKVAKVAMTSFAEANHKV